MNQHMPILNAAIEAELQKETNCSWCCPGSGDNKTSHGLCTRHAQQMIDEILADKAKRAQIAAVTESSCKCVGCQQNNRYGCIQNARPGDQYAVFA